MGLKKESRDPFFEGVTTHVLNSEPKLHAGKDVVDDYHIIVDWLNTHNIK